jgi:hypothetical protein
MAIAFELITMVAVLGLGFVFGRIWEIRRELQRKQSHRPHIAKREHRIDGGLAGQVQTGFFGTSTTSRAAIPASILFFAQLL